MAWKVTNKLFHNKQEFNRGDLLPEELDITPKQLANLVRLGTVVDEKHYNTYLKQQQKIADQYAPRFVDKEEEVKTEYDPREAAEKLDESNPKDESSRPASPKQDTGDFDPSTAEPKANMSKPQLLEIARYRGVTADETATRDEVYKTLVDAEKKEE